MKITPALVKLAQTDILIRNQIIESYIPIIQRIVSKYDISIRKDLENESVFGIIDAINQYKEEFLAQFSTFAFSKIRDRIGRFIYKENKNYTVSGTIPHSFEDQTLHNIGIDLVLQHLTDLEKIVIQQSIIENNHLHEIQKLEEFQNKSIEYIRQLKIRGLKKLQQLILPQEAVIIQYNPVMCKILGDLPQNIINTLYENLSYEIENHQFSDKYITGKWDGKKYLFSKNTFKFRSGLLQRVVNILLVYGVTVKVESYPYANPLNNNIKKVEHLPNLRDYQIQATEAVLVYKRGGLNLPPRTGKTIIALNITHTIQQFPVIFTCFSLEIALQTKQKFEKWLNTEVGYIGDGIVNIKPITIVTVQSILSVYDQKYDFAVTVKDEKQIEQKQQVRNLVEQSKVVICDEYHHYSCKSADFILSKVKNANYIVGLSATPWRNYAPENILLERNIGPKIFKKTYTEMIQRGYLLPPHIYVYNIPKVDTTEKHYQTLYKLCIVENKLRNEIIQKSTKVLTRQGKSVAIIVSQIRHGEILKKMIPNSVLLTGKEKTEQRQNILERLLYKRQLVVISTLLDEGVDVPSLDAVIIAAAGKSSINTLQRMRCLTPYEGKTHGIVIDFNDKNKFLIRQSKIRIEQYKSEPEFKVKFRKVISKEGKLQSIKK